MSSMGKEKEANPSILPITQVILKLLPSSHEQDFFFFIVFLPLVEGLCFSNIIQLSAAKHSAAVWFKG